MSGPECSLIALCDGTTAVALPLAQDHKRIGEGDTGPNTGGMGAYAPAPLPYTADELVATFVQPILDHFAAAGTPYIGSLYAGLMLTAEGPRLVEYNVRFGDPEAQAVLPLLDGDLAEIALAAASGRLADVDVSIRSAAACTVVAAATGYPNAPRTGDVVTLPTPDQLDGALLFPAGLVDGVTSGGRVLSITGLGEDLAAARANAYTAIEGVDFAGMQYRRDIGWRAPGAALTSYAAAGVDIVEGNRAVTEMRHAVEGTHGAEVVAGVGSFGGAFSAKAIAAMDDPVLVASTDGVGTKVELAARLGRVRGLGHDIVNHCVGDVFVQSARPLFFLDYIAASKLDADVVAEIVSGMADACSAAGCTLLGGETAEMPGVYNEGSFDIAGTLVGVAERETLLPRSDVAAGDVLIGVASSGPHTNGYSLLRKLFAWIPMDVTPAGFDCPLGDALLEPHRNYLPVLSDAVATGAVKALAHITGGGLVENVPRVLPSDVDAIIHVGSWPAPPLFHLVRELATALDDHELHRTLNMGVGMVVVCSPDDVEQVQAAIDEKTWVIGELVPRNATGHRVRLSQPMGGDGSATLRRTPALANLWRTMSRIRGPLRPRGAFGRRADLTQGEHHGQVPVAQALPRRAGGRQRCPDGPVAARRGRCTHPVHERLRSSAREQRRVHRRTGTVARRRVGPVRRRGAAARDRRPVRRDEGLDRWMDGDRRRQLRASNRARR